MRLSRFVLAALILGGAVFAEARISRLYAQAVQRAESSRKPFSDFPPVVGQWRPTFIPLTPRELELLSVDDYLRADFTSPGSADISVYAGYYSNPDRATQHPPTICYPGSGWLKVHEGRTTLQPPGQPSLRVQETLFESGRRRTLVIYWYEVAGYTGADASLQKIMRLGRLLSGRGVAGAMKVQIALPVDVDRSEARQRLEAFLGDFLPALKHFGPNDHERE